MKKSRKSSDNLSSKKDLLNSFSVLTIVAIGIYSLVMLFACLGPYFRDNSVLTFQLVDELSRGDFSYHFSLTEADPILVFITPVALALLQFHFLHQKEYCYTLLSFGIKRKKIYTNRMLIPLLALLVATLAIKGIALWENIDILGFSQQILTAWIVHIAIYTQIILLNYSFTVFCCFLCGRTVEAGFASLSTILLPSALSLFINQMFYFSLYGYNQGYNGSGEDIISKIIDISNPFPFYNCVYSISEYSGTTPRNLSTQLIVSAIWIVISIALLLFNGIFFEKKYKPETSGFKGVNTKIVYLISLTSPLFLTSFLTDYIKGYYYPFIDTRIRVITIVISLLCGVIFAILCNFLVHFTFKRIKVALVSGATIGIVSVAALILGFTGMLGTYNRLPDISEVLYIDVSIPVISSLDDGATNAFNSSYSDSYMVPYITSEEDIKLAMDAHTAIIENTSPDFSGSFSITYYLKDGTSYTRAYQNISSEALECCIRLWETDAVKQDIKMRLLPEEDGSIYSNYLPAGFTHIKTECDFTNSGVKIVSKQQVSTDTKELLSEEGFTELRRAVYNDLCAISYEEWYRPTSKMLGSLNFSVCSINYIEETPEPMRETLFFTIPVYDSMTSTLNCLKEYGLYDFLKLTQPKILSVYVADLQDLTEQNLEYIRINGSNIIHSAYYCNNFIGGQYIEAAGFKADKITDMSLIEEYIDKGYNYYLIGNDDALYVMVTYENDDGNPIDVSFVIPKR